MSEYHLASSVTRRWKWLLALGLFMVAVGFMATYNPFATGVATGLLLGIVLILAGSSLVAAAWSDHFLGHRLVDLAFAVILILGGTFSVFEPLAGAVSLAWLIGAGFAAVGVFEVFAGLRDIGRKWLVLLLGMADILIGLYVLLALPQTALVILAVLVGLGFILRGVTLTFLALQLRKAGI